MLTVCSWRKGMHPISRRRRDTNRSTITALNFYRESKKSSSFRLTSLKIVSIYSPARERPRKSLSGMETSAVKPHGSTWEGLSTRTGRASQSVSSFPSKTSKPNSTVIIMTSWSGSRGCRRSKTFFKEESCPHLAQRSYEVGDTVNCLRSSTTVSRSGELRRASASISRIPILRDPLPAWGYFSGTHMMRSDNDHFSRTRTR